MTSIQWTDETWNPVRGCSVVSEGCRNCYAMKQAHRFSGKGQAYEGLTKLGPHGPVWTGKIRLVPEVLDAPLHWKKPRRIFVNSMSDLFHEDVPDEFIVAVFGVMAACPEHTFQILTKRPARMRQWFDWIGHRGGFGCYIRSIRVGGDRTIPNLFASVAKTEIVRGHRCRALGDPWMKVFNAASFHMKDSRLRNVWLGVSVEDQKTADERIPILLQTPAAMRFVSAEPLLGLVDLEQVPLFDPYLKMNGITGVLQPMSEKDTEPDDYKYHQRRRMKLDWVIVGGESGPDARPCDIAWIRSIVGECTAAGVPVFVKQLGSYVADRNDAGFEGDEPTSWPMNTNVEDPANEWNYQGAKIRIRLKDRKGGDPAEWPADLRVREWPR